ncbi:MAG: class I SAM-dependent methyltransferase [Myxococcota bacterium]
MNALLQLHHGLPREGPGSDACTREALQRLGAHDVTRVLDLGCGPGRQTLVLAETLGVPVVAVDRHRAFLAQLTTSARARGLADRVWPLAADFRALPLPGGCAKLIWSEGAFYVLGLAESLALCRSLLAPGGWVAFTECTWLTHEPPDEVARFWREAYPAMGTVVSNCARARSLGFRVVDTFTLPTSAWWDEYYSPLESRIRQLRPHAGAALTTVLDETEREIALFRRHAGTYGYVFYLLADER